LPRTRVARPPDTYNWIAHHWVQPWQVLAIHSPLAGVLGLALRGISAFLNGMGLCLGLSAAKALPPSIQAADAADAMMNSRLVNFIIAS
jgi:hypothetical protein